MGGLLLELETGTDRLFAMFGEPPTRQFIGPSSSPGRLPSDTTKQPRPRQVKVRPIVERRPDMALTEL